MSTIKENIKTISTTLTLPKFCLDIGGHLTVIAVTNLGNSEDKPIFSVTISTKSVSSSFFSLTIFDNDTFSLFTVQNHCDDAATRWRPTMKR